MTAILEKQWLEAKETARHAMVDTGCWSKQQQMGRRWAIGCVALEITQRCNLDCTLCYLSEHSEAVADIPIEEIYRRIDEIHALYGPNTDVQVTGGDTTLRKRDELISIIRYIKEKNMRSTMMTNGIKATRPLMIELAKAGLNDVALHVDTTQNIKNATDEQSLNKYREKYINNIKGLGISIMFNTTVHQGNFHEIPDLIKFFVSHADSIRTVSFQSQADTGRGIADKRAEIITQETVWKQIEKGLGTPLNHEAVRTGHKKCNRYGMTVVTNNRAYDLFSNSDLIGDLQASTSNITFDRKHKWRTTAKIIGWAFSNPKYILPIAAWGFDVLKQIKKDLILNKGKVNTLSFFSHSFMDACNLDQERIDACVFKTMTKDGPVSMCAHNANRDDYILQTIPIVKEQEVKFWHPLEGKIYGKNPEVVIKNPKNYPKKKLKGKSRLSHCSD